MHQDNAVHNDQPTFTPLLAGWLADTRIFALALICALAASGWAWMVLGTATMGGSAGLPDLGPGMRLFGFEGISEPLAWCIQTLGIPAHGHHGTGLSSIMLAFGMWAAMTMAMMLPTAAPMVTTYCEIADTATRNGKTVSSVLYLMAGYGIVWMGFSVLATALQIGLFESGAMSDGLVLVVPWFGAGTLIIAGVYQFSALKTVCLTKCRMPFSFFFANWRERASGIFGLGVWQGLVCLGCCWALMLIMFTVGLMNLVWMAILGIVMLLEKIVPKPDLLRRAIGAGLLVWGTALAGFAAL
ncbi:MAG: DUF2182 domain-containing protein [Fimbriimonadaceae bacterium]|nr:DUF2182 domain-containing protein [Alphaproteobacteria bacterium]